MKIIIVTPAPPRSRSGNRITAIRWARILKELGHIATIVQEYDNQRCGVLVAIHALRSADSIDRFRLVNPHSPLVLLLSGTDLYRDIHNNIRARRSLKLADRLILLQSEGFLQLEDLLHPKTRVILQSMPAKYFPKTAEASNEIISATNVKSSRSKTFDVCVVGHLRPVKDPFRTAMAARKLPASSRIRVIHMGGALSESMKQRAQSEMQTNPRYHWLGELPRWKMLRRVANSQLLVLTSKMEGGANAISEAIVAGVPVISSRIDGSIGLLGVDYPGYFELGNTGELTELLTKIETDDECLGQLRSWCNKLRPLFDPEHETSAWRKLLAEFST
jgi:putative glycosyltransferase (TIGR04348 family)